MHLVGYVYEDKQDKFRALLPLHFADPFIFTHAVVINLHGLLPLFHVNLNSLPLPTDHYSLILITECSVNYGSLDSRPGMADHTTCIPRTLSAFVNSRPGQNLTPKKKTQLA
jgi:hypothetical protein